MVIIQIKLKNLCLNKRAKIGGYAMYTTYLLKIDIDVCRKMFYVISDSRVGLIRTFGFLSLNILVMRLGVSPLHGDVVESVTIPVYHKLFADY